MSASPAVYYYYYYCYKLSCLTLPLNPSNKRINRIGAGHLEQNMNIICLKQSPSKSQIHKKCWWTYVCQVQKTLPCRLFCIYFSVMFCCRNVLIWNVHVFLIKSILLRLDNDYHLPRMHCNISPLMILCCKKSGQCEPRARSWLFGQRRSPMWTD